MQTIGEVLREIRESHGLLLRHVAAELDVDASFLSKVERGDKKPTREQVVRLAQILNTSEKELLVNFLSDKVVYDLKDDEELAVKAMQVAEKKIAYLRKERNGKR
jgi:transcriptional regulator with XRE-family HTH domain